MRDPMRDPMPLASPSATALAFEALDGWAADDRGAALAAWRLSADPSLAAEAGRLGARAFFEARFVPSLVAPLLLTGYYEPVLSACAKPDARFRVPLHRSPGGPIPSRAEVTAGALRGHEIAWVEDALDAFLLQVQGSGRLRLEDGRELRLGFAARNGLPYTSIARVLVERGELPAEAASIDALRAWAARHPDRLPGLLAENASYVVFRELDLPPEAGPLGTLGVPLTPGRSLAVDPEVVPLGLPVWIEAEPADPRNPPLRRLVVAQDTGSAIRGARGDLFVGTGPEAGARAGRMRDRGRMVVLRPRGAP